MSQNSSDSRYDRTSSSRAPHPPQQQPVLNAQSSNRSAPGSDLANAHQSGLDPFARSIESNANCLMDEVFADIERMLERGVPLQAEPTEADPLELNTIDPLQAEPPEPAPADIPQPSTRAALAVVPKLSPRELTLGEPELESDLFSEIEATPPEPDESPSLDKLLLSIVLASLAIAGGAWFFFRGRLPQATVSVAEGPSEAEMRQIKQDAEFLDYVQRSVERIDRASQETETVASNPPATVLERVYVPIYQPPAVSGMPPASTTLPTPQVTVVPIPAAPSPASPASPTPPAPAANPPSVAAIPNIAPSPTHALIGLLELGDRSAALFEIDGTPQRIQLGERIGSSGWTLVSVSGEEAIIRRNGEVRSVYIGQKF